MSEDEFTVVVAGYPNVGKSSFIRLVSTAEPEIAAYPFTTKGIIVGHRDVGKGERVQFIDTPGVLERPADERNPIERQAVSAIINTADVMLFILDASEHCGYALDDQIRLQDEIRRLVDVPVVTVANKADLQGSRVIQRCPRSPGRGWGRCLTCCSDTERTPAKGACKNCPDQKPCNSAAI